MVGVGTGEGGDDEGSDEEGGEDRSAKMLEEVHKALREMKEDHAKARREEKERQERIEQRLDRAEGRMTPPPTQEDNRRGDERYKTNQGPEDDRRAKGQCREQLKGKCNNAKKCEWVHKDPCIPYRDHGRAGCSNVAMWEATSI